MQLLCVCSLWRWLVLIAPPHLTRSHQRKGLTVNCSIFLLLVKVNQCLMRKDSVNIPVGMTYAQVGIFRQIGHTQRALIRHFLEHGRPEDVTKPRQDKLSNQLIRAFFHPSYFRFLRFVIDWWGFFRFRAEHSSVQPAPTGQIECGKPFV
jgi:hypothetical protein